MTNDITLYVEAYSNIPYITTENVELINILKTTIDVDWREYLYNFVYPNIIAVTISDIQRIKVAVNSVGLTMDIIEVEFVDGSWKKGVEFFLSGKTYVGRRVDV